MIVEFEIFDSISDKSVYNVEVNVSVQNILRMKGDLEDKKMPCLRGQNRKFYGKFSDEIEEIQNSILYRNLAKIERGSINLKDGYGVRVLIYSYVV